MKFAVICVKTPQKPRSKRMLLGSDKLQNHTNEGKGKEKKKEREARNEEKRKRAMLALLGFIMATLKVLAPKKLLDGKGPLNGNVSKIRLYVCRAV